MADASTDLVDTHRRDGRPAACWCGNDGSRCARAPWLFGIRELARGRARQCTRPRYTRPGLGSWLRVRSVATDALRLRVQQHAVLGGPCRFAGPAVPGDPA